MATKETKQYRQLASEVDRVERTALDRAPTGEEVQQVAELVATLRVSAAGGKRYRNLLHRARDVEKRINDPRSVERAVAKAKRAKQRGIRDVLPAGLVGSPGLVQARREVLGGLPTTGRRH